MSPERKAYLLSLTTFPQMTVYESAIARAWLVEHADEYRDVEFSVRVGSGLELGEGFDEPTKRQAALSTQKRIDIVGLGDFRDILVEVKPRITLGALGQLLGYSMLWRDANPTRPAPRLLAIGHDALLDVAQVLGAHGVDVELFPDVTALKPQSSG